MQLPERGRMRRRYNPRWSGLWCSRIPRIMTAGATDIASSTHLTPLDATEAQTIAAAWQYYDGALHHLRFKENTTGLL